MILSLPYPPTSNKYWRVVNGRMVLSRDGRKYKRVVPLLAKVQKCGPAFEGPVVLTVTVYRPIKRGDLSNRLKVLEDALQGVAYLNDEQVVEIHMRRREDPKNPRAVVTIEQFRDEGV